MIDSYTSTWDQSAVTGADILRDIDKMCKAIHNIPRAPLFDVIVHPVIASELSLGGYGGRVMVSDNLAEQFKFPKSKRRRIRKKWSSRQCNYRPSRKVYVINTRAFS